METLLLILVFIAIILVLTRVFGLGRATGNQATRLNNAVSLASKAAEAFSAAQLERSFRTLDYYKGIASYE